MELRKVQKVGYSTLSISLPQSWTRKMGVKKGDHLMMIEEGDGSLRIIPRGEAAEREETYLVDVDQCDNIELLARVIVGNYVLGRSTVRVESSRRLMREQIESVRDVTQRLLGFGIIEEGDRHLILQCSVDPRRFPLRTVMKRMYLLTSIMFKEAVDSLIDRDKDLALDALTREHETDTIYWLIARLLSSAQQSNLIAREIGVRDPMEIVEDNTIIRCLELIGDRVNDLASNMVKLLELEIRGELYERLGQIALITFTMFDKAVKSIFDENIKIASDAVDLRETVELEERNMMKEMVEKLDPETAAILSSLLGDLRIIAELCSAIAEIAINNVIRGENEVCRIYAETNAHLKI